MKSYLSKKFSLAISSAAMCATPFAFASLTSCSVNAHTIQFANFESYMDQTLMKHLSSSYDVQFQWYTVTEMIQTKFKRVYDVAAPSGYELVALYKKGLLEKLDWPSFNVGVTDATDALKLFAGPIQTEINAMNAQFTDYLGEPFNVLDYGVPYFAQTFMFVYKGSPLTFYTNGTEDITTQPTWADIFYTIGPRNPNLDKRFNKDKYKERARIGMLDDGKTLYDVCRIMETGSNEMPEKANKKQLKRTYKYLTRKSKSNWYTLNTDSGVISRNLADHKHGYVGALAWSGDALYSALGAGEFIPYSGNNMHIQIDSKTPLNEIEFLVINKKNEKNEEKNKRIYDVIRDTCLSGYDATPDKTGIGEMEGDHYKYWSMQNWDTVNYTPPLKSIYEYVVNNETTSYWYDQGFDQTTTELFVSILKAKLSESGDNPLFGRTLTQLQNSESHWAWLESRGNL